MKITLETLIRFLPLDDKVKQTSLKNLDVYDQDQKFELSQTLWDTFYQMIHNQVDLEFEKVLEEVKFGKRDSRPDLYQQIESQVYQRFMRDLREQQESEAIYDVRTDLGKILKNSARRVKSQKPN